MNGKINSFQSMGTLDGPGVRFVVFLQGCNLKCAYCHNPETWDINTGIEMSVEEVFQKALRYRKYFGEKGGITLTGGEPLLQSEFVCELLSKFKKDGIHTVIDTNGTILTPKSKEAISLADLIMIDLKMNNNELYQKYMGTNINIVLDFIKEVDSRGKDLWIRQVIIPTINDSQEEVKHLLGLLKPFKNINKIELLPFKKLCLEKYESLNRVFPLKDIPEASVESIQMLENIIPNEYKIYN